MSHSFEEHTSETILRIEAPTWPGVLAQAVRGLAELELRGKAMMKPDSEHEITLDAPDEAALLVDWLNELVFLAEQRRLLAVEAVEITADATHLSARVACLALEQPPALVKAATLHGEPVRRNVDGWQARVVLDI